MEQKTRVNSFRSFLNTWQANTATAAAKSEMPRTILTLLVQRSTPVSSVELLRETKTPMTALASILDSLQKMGWVEVRQAGDVEEVGLTAIGRKAAELELAK